MSHRKVVGRGLEVGEVRLEEGKYVESANFVSSERRERKSERQLSAEKIQTAKEGMKRAAFTQQQRQPLPRVETTETAIKILEVGNVTARASDCRHGLCRVVCCDCSDTKRLDPTGAHLQPVDALKRKHCDLRESKEVAAKDTDTS